MRSWNMRIGSIFHCSVKTLSLLPFHLFPPQYCNKTEKRTGDHQHLPGKCQVAGPASKSDSADTPRAAASFKECQNHRRKSHFSSKKKGVGTAPAGYSQWDGTAAGYRTQRIMSHHCLHHLWSSATSTWATQHTKGAGIPWDGWNPMGSGCFAGHAGTCLPREQENC